MLHFVLGSRTLAGIFVALAIGLLSSVGVPSDSARIAAALSSRPIVPPPAVPAFVHRAVIDTIVAAATSGSSFLMVEGGNRMGKTVAVRAAAARLSTQRTVLWTSCVTSSTADSVLQRLYGLRRNLLVDYFFGILRSTVGPPSQIEELVLSRPASSPEPVLVVERAELLALEELKRLVDFAKELRDAGLGRFIFVFSPSDKLAAVPAFGAMSRARVIPVLDLSRSETLELLGHTCAPQRAAAVYSLLGGHLPHLMDAAVPLFCAGELDEGGMAEAFSAQVRSRLESVEWQIGCRVGTCACQAACAVLEKDWSSSLLAAGRQLLLAEHLIRASLQSRVHVIDAPFVRSYLQLHCKCSFAEAAPAITMRFE